MFFIFALAQQHLQVLVIRDALVHGCHQAARLLDPHDNVYMYINTVSMGVYLVERVAVKSWVDPVQLLFEDVVQSHEQRVHRR